MMSKQLKIFVSSTFVDLEMIREKVLKFLGVLNSDLISMEVFGSNEKTSKEVCLDQVRASNFFIGIYAERYGSIDPDSKKSLTELEYHEAYDMLTQKKLSGLLLYILNDNANWPIKFVDRDSVSIDKLKLFKQLIKDRHTVTIFDNDDELPFQILRDTIRKLEIGNENIYRKRNIDPISQILHLDKPIGMSFFESNYSNLFYGRDEETNDLIKQIFEYNFGLLIGVSGVGKTSILNAGVLPKLESLGWLTCITRPLNSPLENLKKSIWQSFFSNPMPVQFDLDEIILTIKEEYSNKKVLIVIDQFDDLLNSSDEEKKDVIDLLNRLYKIKSKNIHFLISYRGDLEPEIGVFWQKISGAVDGLPRYYLNHLSEKSARLILNKTFDALRLNISDTLLETILDDIFIESKKNSSTGVFPPFLQMVIASLYESQSDSMIHEKDYNTLGRSAGIIANYLYHQLDFLGKDRETAIAVLLSLVNQIGAKRPKKVDEIVLDTQLSSSTINNAINRLLDARLIRSIDSLYEITHDLLAKNIVESLQTDEEKEVRRFKSLLESKTLAYKTTKSALSFLEHLHIYKYRKRINCSLDEFLFLLESSSKTGLPILYWLDEDNIKCISTDHQLTIKSLYWRSSVVIDKKNSIESKNTNTVYDEEHLVNLSKKQLEEKFTPIFERGIESVPHKYYNIKYLKSPIKYKKILCIIALARYGEAHDLLKLYELYNDNQLSFKENYICFRAIIALSQKLNKEIDFDFLIRYKGPYWKNSLDDINAPNKIGTNKHLDTVFDIIQNNEIQHDLVDYCVNILKRISNDTNKQRIQDFITTRVCDHNYEGLYDKYFSLALHLGCDFDYFIYIIKNTINQLNINYVSLLHEKIALLASREHIEYIRTFAKEHLVTEDDLFIRTDHIGVKNMLNQFFFLWVIGCAYCRLIRDEDLSDLTILVRHKLYTIRNAALNRIVKINEENFINEFFNVKFDIDNKINKQFVEAISLLDLKFYLKESLRETLMIQLGLNEEMSIDKINYVNTYFSRMTDPIKYKKDNKFNPKDFDPELTLWEMDDAPF